MIKIKLTAGSKYIKKSEEHAVESLRRLLSAEEGYILPVVFIGKQIISWEIDAILLLPDAIFLLDFKDWAGQRIEVEGPNGKVKRLIHGAWEEKTNSLPNYEYAAREIASRLKRERSWLPTHPRISSVMVFTSGSPGGPPQVSFAGGNPNRPEPRNGVCACRIEQFPGLLAAFRAANPASVQLNWAQLPNLVKVFLDDIKPPATPHPRRIDVYRVVTEHHTDAFLNCTIHLGEGDTFKEPVWIKEYEQVLASEEEQRTRRMQLVLRHADILLRLPQHKNIVAYRTRKENTSHLYIILARTSGVFLSELLTGKPLGTTTEAELQRIPFDQKTRLQILGDLLEGLEFLTQQPGFEDTAYRDLRPESIFVQFTDSSLTAQLFNFDCTKLPGAVTKLSHLKAGQKRSPIWDDYASPELLEYIHSVQNTSRAPVSFTGGIASDIFSWGIVAWELLSGELPFADTEAKLAGKRNPLPARLARHMLLAGRGRLPEIIRLIDACLDIIPDKRPGLARLRSYFV